MIVQKIRLPIARIFVRRNNETEKYSSISFEMLDQ